MAHTMRSHHPICFQPIRCPPLSPALGSGVLNLPQPPCRLLSPLSFASFPSHFLLVRALPKMLSFYLFFQEIIWAGTVRLAPYSSSQCPRQSSFKLLLGSDSSKPLKMARQVGCYNKYLNCKRFTPALSCLSLPKLFGRAPSCPPCNVRHRAPQLQPKPCG